MKRYLYLLVVIFFAFLSVYFIFSQQGLWLFLDSSYYPKNYDEIIQFIYSSFNITDSFSNYYLVNNPI